MLENTQNPIAVSGSAWWPGGRTAQNALVPCPAATARVAATTAPAARRAAARLPTDNTVSGSSARRPLLGAAASTSSMKPCGCTRARSARSTSGASRLSRSRRAVVVQGVDHRPQAFGPLDVVVAGPVVEHIQVRVERDIHARTLAVEHRRDHPQSHDRRR